MWELSAKEWSAPVTGMAITVMDPYDVLIVFVNPRSPTAALHLQVGHCVVALYEAIVTMTDGVCFCQLRSKLRIFRDGSPTELGGMSITPAEEPGNSNNNHTAALENSTRTVALEAPQIVAGSGTSNNTNPIETGQITDPDNRRFGLRYTYLGRRISSKDVSLAVLDALATIAFHNAGSPFSQLETLSDRDQVAIIVEDYSEGSFRQLTYRDAARALKLMYDEIMIKKKSFGDVYLELLWNGRKFGEIRMLNAALLRGNTTQSVADS